MKKIEFCLESCLENPPKKSSDYDVFEITENGEVAPIASMYYSESKGWYFLGYRVPDENMKTIYYLVRRVVDA